MSSAVKVATIGGLLANSVVTVLLLFISCRNYPGGVALQRLHTLLHNQTTGLQCYYFTLLLKIDELPCHKVVALFHDTVGNEFAMKVQAGNFSVR